VSRPDPQDWQSLATLLGRVIDFLPAMPSMRDDPTDRAKIEAFLSRMYVALHQDRDADRTLAIELHRLGVPKAKIARKLEIPRTTIRRWLA
jgi:hypothetical protein